MGPGNVIPVEETEIKAQGAVLAHLPAAQQPVDLLAATVAHLQPPAATPLELAHLLAEQPVIKAGAAGIKTAEEIDTTPRLVLIDNDVICLDAVLVFSLLQRRNLPGTLALVATLQALLGAVLPAAAAAVPPAPVRLATASPAPGRVNLQGKQGLYTASVQVPVSAQKAWNVLTNYESMAGVMPDIQQAKVVSRSGRSLELAQVYQAPYTFGQRIKVRLRVQETAPSQMSYELISGDRIKKLQGTWTITPVKGGVIVRHQIEVVPEIPSFLIGSYYDLTEANLRQSMQILAKLMLKG
jgi:ribosome-associated toxin RatA of RatAB toxin-antitoxin module